MKHGLDFEQAKALWEDDNLLEVPVLRTGEPRFLVIGMIEGKVQGSSHTGARPCA